MLPRAALGRGAGRSCARRASRVRALARDRRGVARRIVLITPAERHELPALKEAGFTGYLVKPVRAASLAAQLVAATPPSNAPAPTRRTGCSRRAASRPARAGLADPGRRGQRDQRAAGARAADAARPPADHRRAAAPRRSKPGCAARDAGAPYDLVLMDVHMPGMRRPRGDAAHPRRRGRARARAHADHRAHRQRLRRGSRRLPRRRHGRLPGQAARPRAARRGAGRGGASRWRRSMLPQQLR